MAYSSSAISSSTQCEIRARFKLRQADPDHELRTSGQEPEAPHKIVLITPSSWTERYIPRLRMSGSERIPFNTLKYWSDVPEEDIQAAEYAPPSPARFEPYGYRATTPLEPFPPYQDPGIEACQSGRPPSRMVSTSPKTRHCRDSLAIHIRSPSRNAVTSCSVDAPDRAFVEPRDGLTTPFHIASPRSRQPRHLRDAESHPLKFPGVTEEDLYLTLTVRALCVTRLETRARHAVAVLRPPLTPNNISEPPLSVETPPADARVYNDPLGETEAEAPDDDAEEGRISTASLKIRSGTRFVQVISVRSSFCSPLGVAGWLQAER